MSLKSSSTTKSVLTNLGERQVTKCSRWEHSRLEGHSLNQCPKLGLVRLWWRACRVAVPCAPWSRAMSHNLYHAVQVAILEVRAVLIWCRLASSSLSQVCLLMACMPSLPGLVRNDTHDTRHGPNIP